MDVSHDLESQLLQGAGILCQAEGTCSCPSKTTYRCSRGGGGVNIGTMIGVRMGSI